MPLEGQVSKTFSSATWMQHFVTNGFRVLRFLRRVAQAATDSVTRRLFLAAYEASDDAFWRNCAARHEWRSLGGIIEFTPDFLAVSDKRAAPIYLISIRAASNTSFKRVTIKVKVKKSGVIHQQEITQNRLCHIPVRKALASIPLKPKFSKDADRHRLGDIYIRLSEAVNNDGADLAEGKKIADIFPSTGTNSAPHNQVERWGQYWNINAINALKDDIKALYYRELVQSARKLGRPLTLRRMAYRFLTGRLGLTLIFWSQNLWNAKGIRASIARAEADHQPIRSEKRSSVTA